LGYVRILSPVGRDDQELAGELPGLDQKRPQIQVLAETVSLFGDDNALVYFMATKTQLEAKNAELERRLEKFTRPSLAAALEEGTGSVVGLSGADLLTVPIDVPKTSYRFLKDWMREDPRLWFQARLYETIISVLEQVSLPKMKALEERRKYALDVTKAELKELGGD
jgi:hypothetical protein